MAQGLLFNDLQSNGASLRKSKWAARSSREVDVELRRQTNLCHGKIGVINEEKAMLFQNREHAARLLARRLSAYYKNKNPLVLAIPRGAIRMAEIIADALGGELDVVLVHKLGAPGQPELAIGAIDEAGNSFLSGYGLDIDDAYLEGETQTQFETQDARNFV